jgi:hypothetical protein
MAEPSLQQDVQGEDIHSAVADRGTPGRRDSHHPALRMTPVEGMAMHRSLWSVIVDPGMFRFGHS